MCNTHYFRKRKSVIVQNKSKIVRKYSSDETLSKSQFELDDQKACSSKNTNEVQILTRNVLEDESYILERFRHKFESCWNEISLGEETVSDYINFCQDREHFKLENWKISNRQFRY